MKVIYAGSFDPVTNGHYDIIRRCAAKFDEVIIGVLINREKSHLFTAAERIEMLQELLYDYENVSIKAFSGLLVDFVKQENAAGVIRGLRSVSDYDYEMQMALLNRSLMPNMETFLLPANPALSYVSSSFVREIAAWNGDLSNLVPPVIEKRLRDKCNGRK